MRHPTPDGLARFADGLASPLEARSVSEHLAVCSLCDELLQERRDLDELLRGDPVEAPAGYFDTLPERVERRLGPPGVERRGSGRVWGRRSARVFGSLLAAAATAAFLALLSPWTLRRATETDPLSVSTERLASPSKGVAPLRAEVSAPSAEPTALPKLREKVGGSGGGAAEREAISPAPQGALLGSAPPPAAAAPTSRSEARPPLAEASGGVEAPRPERRATLGDAGALVRSRAEPVATAPSEGAGVRDPRVPDAEVWRARARELETRAERSRDAVLADDARLGACEAWLEAFEVGGVEADRRAAEKAAEAYLARADARQKVRALRVLARLSPSGGASGQ